MQRDIHARPKLLIVSDTAVFDYDDGRKEAFEPVVREIEHFGVLFDSVTWIAARHNMLKKRSNVKEVSGVEVRYLLFDAVGGGGFWGICRILKTYFVLFFMTLREIRKADVIHTRGPSHPAIIASFLSLFFKKKMFWQKYAGNWIRKHEALSYRFQKFLMRKAKHGIVTVNGQWDGQRSHVVAFENPCLTEEERILGLLSLENKDYCGKLNFVFVGRLEEAKGISRIVDAFAGVENGRIGIIHFVGDGQMREVYEERISNVLKYDVVFHGVLDKEGVLNVLSESHIAILPSDSEGFPKFVAEAANFGCVNIVSDISCLSQYIVDEKSGFLMRSLDAEGLSEKIERCLSVDCDLRSIAEHGYRMGDKFTYNYYNKRIVEEIIMRGDV